MTHNNQMEEQQSATKYTTLTKMNSIPLNRSDSTATVILEESEVRPNRHSTLNTLTPSQLASLSFLLRSMQKTSGQFNSNCDLSDKMEEQLTEEDMLFIQDLLNQYGTNDSKLDGDDFMRLDSKQLDSRTLSEFIRSESFDQLMAVLNTQNSETRSLSALLPRPSISFSELRPVSPEFPSQSYPETTTNTDHSMIYPSDSSSNTLNAVEHDHAFLCKRTAPVDSSSSSLSSNESKTKRSKRLRNVSRAEEVKTPEDLKYYLERRRKNNEASRASRAVRKQKFDDMDQKCEEYQRVNEQLRVKIATLEKVTINLKSGLVNNFQRK